jgi:hypothetical protein
MDWTRREVPASSTIVVAASPPGCSDLDDCSRHLGRPDDRSRLHQERTLFAGCESIHGQLDQSQRKPQARILLKVVRHGLDAAPNTVADHEEQDAALLQVSSDCIDED